MATGPALTRTVFQTSRVLEFFSEQELTMQIGFPRPQWPLALLKELIDNALDACETAGHTPDIAVTVTADTVRVQDNGPGLPVETIKHSLDYLVRVSDKAYYVSPTRGQLGNALKCVWAAPYVVDGTHGRVEVRTGGVTYQIDVTLDPLAQQPTIQCTTCQDGEEPLVKNGTCLTIHWPEIASSLASPRRADFYNIADLMQRYAAFNPHGNFRYTAAAGPVWRWSCTTPTGHKWLPSHPTSPHWYTVVRFQALLTAYLQADRLQGRRRTVREVVADFAGLSGTGKQKQVTAEAQLSGATLEDLVEGGTLAVAPVRALLTAMQTASRVIKPEALGVLGETHVRAMLGDQLAVDPASIQYKKYAGVAEGLPYVLELACGWDAGGDRERRATTLLGINWTPALRPPFPSLAGLLGEARVDSWDPVIVVAHLACPRLEVTDRGKSAVTLPWGITQTLHEGVQAVTKPWTALKRQADRDERVRRRDMEHWRKQQQRQGLTLKEAASQVMEEAYLLASDGGTLPANARQIMYAARPRILALTQGKLWKKSSTFTQTLLPDFLKEHASLTAGWDVVYDARGHFREPHTGLQLGIGTVEVRDYLKTWGQAAPDTLGALSVPHAIHTHGPTHRFRYALFVEKEGFNALLDRAQLAERYDLALMSTKGQTVTAARTLVEALSRVGVTILVLHDFDKAGLEILDKFRSDTRRYTYAIETRVIDLGLRLAEALAMGLQSESVTYDSKVDPCESLRRCGATEAECAFLVHQRRALARKDEADEGEPAHQWEEERIESTP